MASCISSWVVMTNGPCWTTGSRMGSPRRTEKMCRLSDPIWYLLELRRPSNLQTGQILRALCRHSWNRLRLRPWRRPPCDDPRRESNLNIKLMPTHRCTVQEKILLDVSRERRVTKGHRLVKSVRKTCPIFVDGLRKFCPRIDSKVQIGRRGQGANVGCHTHRFASNDYGKTDISRTWKCKLRHTTRLSTFNT